METIFKIIGVALAVIGAMIYLHAVKKKWIKEPYFP